MYCLHINLKLNIYINRLLPFLIARIGQDCSIFSLEEDARWMNKLCSDIYIEAMKIAQHNYFNMDLLMEQSMFITPP